LMALLGPADIRGIQVAGVIPPVRALLLAAALSLALSLLLIPTWEARIDLVRFGLLALGGVSVLAMASSFRLIAILIVLLGGLHATRPSPRSFAERMRNPAWAAALLGVGGFLLTSPQLASLARFGVLAALLGLIAAAGLIPYLSRVVPDEPATASALLWTSLAAPVLSLIVVVDLLRVLNAQEKWLFDILCLGLGGINLAWGLLASWRAPDVAGAWRNSFLADWGLALAGFGLISFSPLGFQGAYLTLMALVLGRLPFWLAAQSLPLDARPARWGPVNLLIGLALAGAAPFAGFAARLLLLEAATNVSWFLAAGLVLAMLVWLGPSFRLGASLGRPRGLALVGSGLVLAVSVVLGVAPGVGLALGGL
jgi:hypothetical protein